MQWGVGVPLLSQDVPIIVVGTNSDLIEEREVSRDAIIQLSAMWGTCIYPLRSSGLGRPSTHLLSLYVLTDWPSFQFCIGMPIYEVSVRKGWHVRDALEDLVRQLRTRYPTVPRRPSRWKAPSTVNDKCVMM